MARSSRNSRRNRQDSTSDKSHRNQWIAGALTAAFAGAAYLTTGFGLVTEPLQTLTLSAAPLHGVFLIASAFMGATAMAAIQSFNERRHEKPRALRPRR